MKLMWDDGDWGYVGLDVGTGSRFYTYVSNMKFLSTFTDDNTINLDYN